MNNTNSQQVGMQIKDPSGIPIARFGTFPDGSIALKVAKSGTDVTKATDSELIFNSNQDMFKIVKSIDLTLPSILIPGNGDDTSQQFTIPHEQNFIPAFLVYALIPPYGAAYTSTFPTAPAQFYVPMVNTLQISDANSIEYFFYTGIDDTNVYLARGMHNFNSLSFNSLISGFRVYVLQESAAQTT